MIRLIRRLLFTGWCKAPEVSPLEGLFMRLLFAMALLWTVRAPSDYHLEPHPVGLLKLLHGIDDHRLWLTWLSDPASWEVYHWAFIGIMILYVAGIALPIVLPIGVVLQLMPNTLMSSQEFNFHGTAMISMVGVAQALTVWYYTITKKWSWLGPDAKLRSWLLMQSMMVVAGAYFISVIAKMENSHGSWFWNSNNIALDMVKTQRQTYYNKLDPSRAEIPPQALYMLQHPMLARAMFSSGVLLEASCIVILLGNRLVALLIGLSLVAMHRSIDMLMGGVAFPLDELCDFIFLIGVPFAMAWCVERIQSVAVRYGVLIGGLGGIVSSVGVHRSWGRFPTPLAEYLLAMVYKTCSVWSSMDWAEFFNFMTPAILCGAAGAALGAGIAYLIERRSSGTGGVKPAAA